VPSKNLNLVSKVKKLKNVITTPNWYGKLLNKPHKVIQILKIKTLHIDINNTTYSNKTQPFKIAEHFNEYFANITSKSTNNTLIQPKVP